MPSPRYTPIDIETTPYYHCISRCVRRAFLCGRDRVTGRSFDHRKGWVVERLAVLTSIFAVRLCAYAIMSNHFHLVVRIDSERARGWSEAEVVERYGRLFAGAVRLWQRLPRQRQEEVVACWRARLADLSWFMRCLNESIARRANAEDRCTGRFWEGRFRSQALLDEAGLLACMAYVDLNPVRAGIAQSLQDSEFTSIQQRLAECGRMRGPGRPSAVGSSGQAAGSRKPCLLALRPASGPLQEETLPVDLDSYLELLAATGAALYGRQGQSGLPEPVQRTLQSVGIRNERWLEAVRTFPRRFFAMIGCVHKIRIYCARTDRDRAKGSRWAAQIFRNCA